MAQIIALTQPEPRALVRLAQALRQGALIAIPTETLYGLAADHRHPVALDCLAVLKGREDLKPFPLILNHPAEAQALAQEIPPVARDLMAHHWPGPLTLIFKARPGLHPRLVSTDGGVAMRVSNHPVAGGLAAALGAAITATSANPSGQPPVSRAQDLDPTLVAGLDYILDGDPTPGGPPSTVLDVRERPWRVVRQGAVYVPLPG